jgi:RimJ/RimL family protein N-acetyltransferase
MSAQFRMDRQTALCQGNLVKTDRLIIEPLLASHADELVELLDERVNRYFSPQDVPSSQAAQREQFANMERASKSEEVGPRFHPFVVRTADALISIGRLEALVHNKDAEIAFVFVPSSWGNGYATEAAGAMVEHFERVGVERFWACVTQGNEASLALCNRLGFKPAELPQDFELWTYDEGDVILKLDRSAKLSRQ